MTPHDALPAEFSTQLARRLLRTIDDTPIPAMDATFYAHYFEELRLIVEDLLDKRGRSPAAAQRVWLVCDCEDLVACCNTEDEAVEARADLQHRLDCDYGPDPDLRESITITPVLVEPMHFARTGHAG